MNDVIVFNSAEFGNVRTVMIDKEPWFVGKDVCKVLGYARPENAVKDRIDEDDRIYIDEKLILDLGLGFDYKNLGQRGGWIVNESGLYSLIFGSKLESAKKFKKWVTSEVLPQLRKTGAYETKSLHSSPMELLTLHYEAIKEIDTRVDGLTHRFDKFEADMPLLGVEESRITQAVHKRGIECIGGKESSAYSCKGLRAKVFSDIYRELKRQFGVTTYKAIKRGQTDLAIRIIQQYELPVVLASEIDDCNRQMSF